VLLLQRAAGNRAVSQMVQRQKKAGHYELAKEARLRGPAPGYSVLHTLSKGTRVQVLDNGGRTSNFKAGRKTNEHSWTRWQATEGWIEDSKLKAMPAPPQTLVASPPPSSVPAASTSSAVSSTSLPKPKSSPPQRTQTAAIGIEGKKRPGADTLSMGSESFQEKLTEETATLSGALLPNVRFTEVKAVDQTKLKVTIVGERIYTHDGRHRLDTEGAEIRYVLCQVGADGLQLYASQMFKTEITADTADTDDESEASETPALVDRFRAYPSMESHAQITGSVIGAGDFVVSDGRITQISNKSGTWHPHGDHLVTALRALSGWKVLDAELVRAGKIKVKQFLPDLQSDNPDAGDLVTLDPRQFEKL
jgi:hypothetical protein